jgi:hypothetical protein
MSTTAGTNYYLSPDAFAERLPGVSVRWVRRELAAGRIRGAKIAGRWFVPEDALVTVPA